MIPKLLLALFGLLLSLVAAADLGLQIDTNLKPTKETKKGVLDTNKGWIRFGSYFDVKETPTDEQLAKMAHDAGESMKKLASAQKVHKQMVPAVLTALAVDNQVFLSSSLRGDKYIYPKEKSVLFGDNVNKVPHSKQLRDALTDCMNAAAGGVEDKQEQHRAKANCGEVMVVYEWLMAHEGKDLRNKTPQPLIASYDVKRGQMVPPCSQKKQPGDYGCKDFVDVDGMNFKAVHQKTKYEDYDCIIDGNPKHQNLPVEVPNRGANASTPTPSATPSHAPSHASSHTPSATPSHTPSHAPSHASSHTPSSTPSAPAQRQSGNRKGGNKQGTGRGRGRDHPKREIEFTA